MVPGAFLVSITFMGNSSCFYGMVRSPLYGAGLAETIIKHLKNKSRPDGKNPVQNLTESLHKSVRGHLAFFKISLVCFSQPR